MTILNSKRTGTLSAIIEHCPSGSEHCYVSEIEICNSVGGSLEVKTKLLNPLWIPLTDQEVLQIARWIMINDGIEFEHNQVVEDRHPKILVQTYKIIVTSEHTLLSSN